MKDITQYKFKKFFLRPKQRGREREPGEHLFRRNSETSQCSSLFVLFLYFKWPQQALHVQEYIVKIQK